MNKLPEHILQELAVFEISSSSGLEEIENKSKRIECGFLNIFYSKDSREELLEIARSGVTHTIEILPPRATINNWYYHQILHNKSISGEIIEIPFDISACPAPPTDVEKNLVRAWATEKNLIDSVKKTLQSNKVLLLIPKVANIENDILKSVSTLFNANVNEGGISCPGYSNTSTLNLTNESSLFIKEKIWRKLLKSASSENQIRWRFLSFYRILEYGYLQNLFDTLRDNFFENPKESVSNADTALKNEFNQLVGLIDNKGLSDSFSELPDLLKRLIGQKNRFAAAISRECDSQPVLKNTTASNKVASKGALICYKIRCSIVHAGEHSVLYDKFDDADAALKELIIPLENGVIKFLGIELID